MRSHVSTEAGGARLWKRPHELQLRAPRGKGARKEQASQQGTDALDLRYRPEGCNAFPSPPSATCWDRGRLSDNQMPQTQALRPVLPFLGLGG